MRQVGAVVVEPTISRYVPCTKGFTATQTERCGKVNPIFTGAAFMWDNIVIWDYERVRKV